VISVHAVPLCTYVPQPLPAKQLGQPGRPKSRPGWSPSLQAISQHRLPHRFPLGTITIYANAVMSETTLESPKDCVSVFNTFSVVFWRIPHATRLPSVPCTVLQDEKNNKKNSMIVSLHRYSMCGCGCETNIHQRVHTQHSYCTLLTDKGATFDGSGSNFEKSFKVSLVETSRSSSLNGVTLVGPRI
jgi:hypothetical protein